MARRGLLLAFLLFAWPSMASAQQLTWSAPRGCSSREKVLEMVRHTLGRALETRRPLDVHVDVQPGVHGRVIVDFTADELENGERSTSGRHFEAESCDAAAAAIAVIVALMMDPTRAASEPTPEAAPPSAPPPVPPPPPMPTAPVLVTASEPPSPPASVASSPPAASPVASSPEAHPAGGSSPSGALALLRIFSARLAVAGDLGTESHANVGAELAVAATVRGWRLEAVGKTWANGSATAALQPSEGVRLGLTTLGARAAYRFEWRGLGLAPLVGLEVDHASATGFGGSAQASPGVTWTGVDFGAVGTWWLTRWLALALTAEGVVPLSRPTFVATNPAPVGDFSIEQPSIVAGRASLGVECRFF